MKSPIYSLPDNITWKELQDSVVIVNTASGDYYTLNETASEIWKFILHENSLQVISDHIKHIYPQISRKEIDDDIKECLKDWINEKILIPSTLK